MKRVVQQWSTKDLVARVLTINFPEYQREPNIWSRRDKQRLIDSMLRGFDIASIYLYRDADGSLDCIDGRQRIGAILSFFGENSDDSDDNLFPLKFSNEILHEERPPYNGLQGLTFSQILAHARSGNADAERAITALQGYLLNLVLLSEAGAEEEFNLQFTRLNLGAIINAGEKLHAMVGQMRDTCFGPSGLGQHPFFLDVAIPARRYSREQVAAQIIAQVFEKKRTGQFTRTRHVDLQRLLKDNSQLSVDAVAWIREIRDTLDALHTNLAGRGRLLRSRSLTVSIVVFCLIEDVYRNFAELQRFLEFFDAFSGRLRWQLQRYRQLRPDSEYRYLIEFQRHLTQASAEKPAVEARHRTLVNEFAYWREQNRLTGDREFEAKWRIPPGTEVERAE